MTDHIKKLADARAKIKAQAEEIERLKADRDNASDGHHTFKELYEHRHALFAAVSKSQGGWKSKLHDDGTMFDGWFIAGCTTPQGPITYHLPLEWWDAFPAVALAKAPAWDGHTSTDVVGRIKSLLEVPAELATLREQVRTLREALDEIKSTAGHQSMPYPSVSNSDTCDMASRLIAIAAIAEATEPK
jgi:hypothetical protein